MLFARVPRRMSSLFARLASRGLVPVIALAVASFATDASAAPKDAQADKAHSRAMDELYLESKFDEAASALQKGIDACGASGCTPAKKARLYIDLGTVQAGGQGKGDEATASFVEALKLDKAAALDPDYIKKEIQKAYDDAKAKAGGSGSSGSEPSDGGALTHEPHAEQKVNTPVPIHVVVPENMKVGRVVVRYIPTGLSETREKELEKAGQAYRGNIPCDAVVEEGTLKYWISAESKDGTEVASAGNEATPLSTEIKKSIEGKPPRWPGFAPPSSCAKGTGTQCVDDKDCGPDQTCSSSECIAKGDTTAPPDEKKGDLRRAWLSVWVAPNLAMVSGDNVCTDGGSEGHFVCQREDGSKYAGTPTEGQANNVNFGFGVGPVALGLGFDYLVGTSVTVGGRLGFAFGGASGDDVSFFPVHVEARGAYYFTNNPFANTGVRPYVFLAAGAAQVDVPVDVEVVEDGEACGAENPEDFSSPCFAGDEDDDPYPYASARIQTLKAYKQAGLGFAALGFGVAFAPADPVAIHVGLRGGITFPVLVPTVAPELAFAVGF